MKKRLIILATIFILFLGACVGRLATIVFIDGEKYKELAIKQSTLALQGVQGRGNIFDRNGKSLTEAEESFTYFIEKRKMDSRAMSLFDQIHAQEANEKNEKYHIYRNKYLDKEINDVLSREYGTIIMRSKQRYLEDQPAVHIIGYVNNMGETGACGIEKDYDEILASSNKTYNGLTDGHGYLIPGLGIDVTGKENKWGIITTIDLEIQNSAERILADASVNGSIIVVDADTGEILATASSPIYSPSQIAEYLESDEKEFLNKSTKCKYPPGSIFKIIVAAVALEKGIVTPESTFICDGYQDSSGHLIKCSTGGPEGHGEITLSEAFSYSCNSVFVQLGQMIGGEAILNMAQDFGILEEAVGGLSSQSTGNLPSLEESLGAGIGNLSIGQGKILVVPMQVARITRTIANNGMDTRLSLINATLEGDKGTVLYPKEKPRRIISVKTAKAIKKMMKKTVLYGTADNLLMTEGMTAAGKTGSSEARYDGKDFVHSWFTGYAPAENPQYIITVFVENGSSGRRTAVPIFQDMLEAIFD